MTIMKILFVFLALCAFIINTSEAQYITDYDGNEYDTITIGAQVWMKQNLKVTHYNDGTPIPNVSDSTAWAHLTSGARCYYNNDSVAFDSVYGALYNWYAVSNPNICPAGWHVSTNTEWQQTEVTLGGDAVAGGEMKEAGIVHWLSPNYGATNNSGFTGLPGGLRNNTSVFEFIQENGLWWTTTNFSSTLIWSTYLWYAFAGVDHNPLYKRYGLSIRCVKNDDTNTEELNTIENLYIYPNPSKDKISIKLPETGFTSITLINSAGQIVIHQFPESPEDEIDISNLTPGIYFIQIEGPTMNKHIKFIKE